MQAHASLRRIGALSARLALCAALGAASGCASDVTINWPKPSPPPPPKPAVSAAAPAPVTAPAAPATPAPPPKPLVTRAVEPGEFSRLQADSDYEIWLHRKVLVSPPSSDGTVFYTVCEATVFAPRGTYSLPSDVERKLEALAGIAESVGDMKLMAGSSGFVRRASINTSSLPEAKLRDRRGVQVSRPCGGRAVVYGPAG